MAFTDDQRNEFIYARKINVFIVDGINCEVIKSIFTLIEELSKVVDKVECI